MPTLPPSELAAQLVRTDAALHERVTASAAHAEHLIELKLSDDPALATRVIRLLPARLARDVTDDVLARRELARLTPPRPVSAFHLGPRLAASKLRAYYTEAQRRYGVRWQLLAAVNFVETDFGRLREASVAGAQGPMQFLPSTWARWGRGDIHDPHQAILAAARFLRANGLYRYNPSWAYVDAVKRYAGRITRDPRAFLVYYARPLVVRTPDGYRLLK